jgi:flagella basal body P-ring formation protein FlgA
MLHLPGRVVVAIALVAMLVSGVRRAFAEPAVVTPAEAIARAVAQRVGGGATVEVTALETSVAAQRALHALPEPGGRAGTPMRFVLMVGRMRRGVAMATVKVVASYARAARAIGRNATIGAGDIDIVTSELPAAGMKRLPDTADVVGLIARRDIAAGEPLTQAVLDVPLAVRAGDAVELTVIAGRVRVTARATASSSGHEGEIIRVVPDGGRALRARISRPGAVEVVQ